MAFAFLWLSACQCVISPEADAGAPFDAGAGGGTGGGAGGGVGGGTAPRNCTDGGVQCLPNSYCDSTGSCVLQLREGQPCTGSGQCESPHVCAQGECTSTKPCMTWACVNERWDHSDAGFDATSYREVDPGLMFCGLGYGGGVLAPNGHVIAVPAGSGCVLDITPSPLSFVATQLPSDFPPGQTFGHPVLMPNGDIIAGPEESAVDGGCVFLLRSGVRLQPLGPVPCVDEKRAGYAHGVVTSAGVAVFASRVVGHPNYRVGPVLSDGGYDVVAQMSNPEALSSAVVTPTGTLLWLGEAKVGQLLDAGAADAARVEFLVATQGLQLMSSGEAAMSFVGDLAGRVLRYDFATNVVTADPVLAVPTGVYGMSSWGDVFVMPKPEAKVSQLHFNGVSWRVVGSQTVTSSNGNERFSSVIATPAGLVAVPGQGTAFVGVLAIPEGRTLPALLSPYFNRY